MTSTHPSGKSSQMPDQLVIQTYLSDDCEGNMQRKLMENGGPCSNNSVEITHYTPITQRLSSKWRLNFHNVLLVVVCLMLVGVIAQLAMLLQRVQALENRECDCTHHQVPTQVEADWPMASMPRDPLVQQEPLLYQPLQSSRIRRSKRSVPSDIKKYVQKTVKKGVKKGMKCPVESFVGNFWKHGFWDSHFSDDSDQTIAMRNMHCRPNVSVTARVEFPGKGCKLAFFERSPLLPGAKKKKLLKFSNETGIFTVQRSGVYLLQVNITIIDKTRRHEAGLYLGNNPIMACQHGGFRCPTYNTDDHSSEYRICTMNGTSSRLLPLCPPPKKVDYICNMHGVYHLMEGDELSLQTMANKMAFRLEEKKNAVFTAALINWTNTKTKTKTKSKKRKG